MSAGNAKERQENPVVDLVRKTLLASIGALAITRDELEQAVNRLVERGEMAEKDARKLLDDILAARKKELDAWGKRVEERVEKVLERLRIPQREDLEELEARLANLEAKLDELMSRLDKEAQSE